MLLNFIRVGASLAMSLFLPTLFFFYFFFIETLGICHDEYSIKQGYSLWCDTFH